MEYAKIPVSKEYKALLDKAKLEYSAKEGKSVSWGYFLATVVTEFQTNQLDER